MDAAMMSLREYRSGAAHLADFLPWAALVRTTLGETLL